jgi:hypothetical protein
MFWIFLLLVLLMVVGCYVAYKEAKHHELHKLRADFIGIEEKIKDLDDNALSKKDKDLEAAELFKGEIIGIEKALGVIAREDDDCDLIQEIEDDLVKIKEKIAGFFGN